MKKIIYFSFIVMLLASCSVKYKSIPYFTDLPLDSSVNETIINQTVLKIQKNDILGLTVTSLNPEASLIYNRGNTSSVQGSSGGNVDPMLTSNGFTVDQNGNIQMQSIGDIKVEGLTIVEARKVIEKKLMGFLKEPVVSMRIVNYRVSVLGDVVKPGVYPVTNDRINIVEALSMAGDLNLTAERKSVLLIREVKGERQFVRLNLQSKDLFNSPYYYMQNNDVIYVKPSQAKFASIDATYRNVGLAVSVLSVLALLIVRL